MTTRFSKQKLAKAQKKKAKGGIISGLLSKEKTGDVSKKEPVITPSPAHSSAMRPTSPTSSLAVIAYAGEEARKKKKVSDKSFLPTFWDDANTVARKAHKAFSLNDLSLLIAKSSSEVMLSHIQKLVQVHVVSRIYFFFSFALFLLKDIFCRLWGSHCLSLENSWTWRRRWPRLSL